MKRLKLWGGKVWQFFGDDRVGLLLGGAVLHVAIGHLIAGRLWFAALGMTLAASCIWTGWRNLAKKSNAVCK